jgi:hypothetical protein
MDPLPPKLGTTWASRNPHARKWVLWGCGCGGLGIAGLAAVFGVVFWQIKKATDELSGIGAAYLSTRAEVAAEIGTVRTVEPKPLQVNVQVKDDRGEAWFAYAVAGDKASGEAEVQLLKRGGPWQAAGARLRVGSRTVTIGTPGAWPGSGGKD